MAQIGNTSSTLNSEFNVICTDSTYSNLINYIKYYDEHKNDTNSSLEPLGDDIKNSFIICAPTYIGSDTGEYDLCVSDYQGNIVRLTPGFTNIDTTYFELTYASKEKNPDILNKGQVSLSLSSSIKNKIDGLENNITNFEDKYLLKNISNDIYDGHNENDPKIDKSFIGLYNAYTNLYNSHLNLKSELDSIKKALDIENFDSTDFINVLVNKLSTYFVRNANENEQYLWSGTKSNLPNERKNNTIYVVNPS